MKVRDLDIQPLISTSADESLSYAADRMRYYEVGSLAVVSAGRVDAIITERDLSRALADRADPDLTLVRSYMTYEPATVSADAHVDEAARLMLDVGVRHLPVVEGSRIVGMVSVRDLLGAELPARSRS